MLFGCEAVNQTVAICLCAALLFPLLLVSRLKNPCCLSSDTEVRVRAGTQKNAFLSSCKQMLGSWLETLVCKTVHLWVSCLNSLPWTGSAYKMRCVGQGNNIPGLRLECFKGMEGECGTCGGLGGYGK